MKTAAAGSDPGGLWQSAEFSFHASKASLSAITEVHIDDYQTGLLAS